MAVAMDLGEKANVHPKNKQDLAERLARIARAQVYGEKIEYSGPVYESMEVQGNSIRVRFTHAGRGLVAKGGGLKWFQVAGADKRFVAATAKIDERHDRGCRPRRRPPCSRAVCVAPLAGRREPLQRRRPARAAVPLRRLGNSRAAGRSRRTMS